MASCFALPALSIDEYTPTILMELVYEFVSFKSRTTNVFADIKN
jgi:hypothetical protein